MRRHTRDSLEPAAKRIGELVAAGYAPPGRKVATGEVNATTVYAREIGIATDTLRPQIQLMRKFGLATYWGDSTGRGLSKQKREPEPEISRAEVHDSSFWRKKCVMLEKQIADAEHVIGQISGLTSTPFSIPDWLIDARESSRRSKSVILAHTSDWHMGEKIDAEEIQGINEFNVEICRQRLRRYFSAAVLVGQRWASDTDCVGAFLTLAGDLISGSIHDELSQTNELTSHEQCIAASEEGAAGIRVLKEAYGRVHVVVVPGNHGRTTHKSTAKLYARLSYDILIGSMIAKQFEGDPRVTFQFGKSKDQVTPIFGRSVLTTHGDKMGSGGGMGFAGPILPIVRGTKKISAQQASIGRQPDLMLTGHYHMSANPGNVLANGSIPGYSEFADDIRASIEPPQQWLALLHSRWWLRERATIQLTEPELPAKPVVRIPAGWETA